MCGRFSLRADVNAVCAHFSLSQSVVLKPRYNIAPGQVIPIIRRPGELEFITWGLHPKWLKPEQSGFINARMETLSEKPSFKKPFSTQRCLIVADGYYEWKHIGKIKQPFFIKFQDDALFAFAGLYDNDTCAVITKESINPKLKDIHERTPVILSSDYYAAWLNAKTPVETLQSYMQQDMEQNLKAFPVSTKVNNPDNDFAECINPLQ